MNGFPSDPFDIGERALSDATGYNSRHSPLEYTIKIDGREYSKKLPLDGDKIYFIEKDELENSINIITKEKDEITLEELEEHMSLYLPEIIVETSEDEVMVWRSIDGGRRYVQIPEYNINNVLSTHRLNLNEFKPVSDNVYVEEEPKTEFTTKELWEALVDENRSKL